MKPIHALIDPTPHLSAYLERMGAKASWEEFGHGDPEAKPQLAEALANTQHGLCGYCENRLHPRDRQIEHVVPRSDVTRGGQHRALDVTNMIACCTGNAPFSHDPIIRGDPSRYLKPVRKNLSCGQAKSDVSDEGFLDPRELPALPLLMNVLLDGEIEPDANACASAGLDANRVAWTINTLGLNVQRLKDARSRRLRDLEAAWGEHLDQPAVLLNAAREELLPNTSGELSPFFTTAASYFAFVRETILAEPPQAWL